MIKAGASRSGLFLGFSMLKSLLFRQSGSCVFPGFLAPIEDSRRGGKIYFEVIPLITPTRIMRIAPPTAPPAMSPTDLQQPGPRRLRSADQ